MNDPEPLLHDVLSAGANSAAESESLDCLLQAARRTRRARKLARGGMALVLVAVVSVAVAVRHPIQDRSRKTTGSGPVVAPQVPLAAPIKSISDEELFALFPGRQLALIGPPGDQRLVILDEK